MVEKLSGENAPKLHLVTFNAPDSIESAMDNLARETWGHFHSHTMQLGETNSEVKDSDINEIKEEIAKAQAVLCELKSLQHGNLGQQLLETIREVWQRHIR